MDGHFPFCKIATILPVVSKCYRSVDSEFGYFPNLLLIERSASHPFLGAEVAEPDASGGVVVVRWLDVDGVCVPTSETSLCRESVAGSTQ